MNIFNFYLDKIKFAIINNKEILNINYSSDFKGVQIESPPEKFNSDLSTNIPMVLGKLNKIDPKKLAENLIKILKENIDDFQIIELAGPGFLNITLSRAAIFNFTKSVVKSSILYGSNSFNKSYNVEFVSANPTGPMHVGHCRGAIYGDVLSNLLIFNGNKVIKEYYINDYGKQIENFTKSVFLRMREIQHKEKFINSEDLYPGQYIIDIAKNILKSNVKIDLENFEESYEFLKSCSLKGSMKLIESDLHKLGIKHNNFVSETKLVKKNLVKKTIDNLKKKNFVTEGFLEPPKGEGNKNWKKVKRLIFKSTLFGDDLDRALQKDDGSWTYFANDLAYHADKISRKYDFLINVLGADHTGYIKRITAGVDAISEKNVKLDCRVCQLVKLYKAGKPFKMSKRAGEFILVSDLLKEVGRDAIRFMMLNRSNDMELDFDFDKVIEKSKDNPVFYVQYCFARICSLFRAIGRNIDDEIKINSNDLIINEYEKKILRKIFDWPKIVEVSAKKYEPHRISFYLYDLATLFHSYWSLGNNNEDYKFIKNGKIKSEETLLVIKLISIVIKNGMSILNVSLPEKM